MTRPMTRIESVGASAQTTLPATNIASPPIMTGRRPYRSEKGPTKSWPSANIAKNALIIEPVAGVGTSNDCAMCGSDGRRMFVASVPSAAKDARMASSGREARVGGGSGLAWLADDVCDLDNIDQDVL